MYYYFINVLKDTIQEDFVKAMKEKNEVSKSALSGLKAKITETEKSNSNIDLTDRDIVKVVTKAIKQREESADIYKKAGRDELAERELAERDVLVKYMPAQMTDAEIEIAVREIISEISATVPNQNALRGKTLGEFNKKFQGMADTKSVSTVINRLIV